MPIKSYKLVALSGLGGALEFLDFTLYAMFARYISQNFFPAHDSLTGLLSTFAVFSVGYFARPLGGLIFGHFGDKYGRKKSFVLSALLMACATLGMGCLPNYQQIGLAAPGLLLFLRILQGMSVGGEVPGSIVFIFEHYPQKQRGLVISLIFMGITLGNVIGSSLGYWLTHQLSEADLFAWGWRIPFVAGFGLGLVAYLLRKKATETPIFTEILQKQQTYQVPALQIAQQAVPQLVSGIALTGLPAIMVFLFLYLPSYPPAAEYYKVNDLYLINIISFSALALSTPLFGYLSDFVPRKKMIALGATLGIICGYFLFTYFLTLHRVSLPLCIIMTTAIGSVNGCYAREIAESFPASVRYSGVGLTYNTGFALFGGLAPFMATILLKYTQNPLVPYYLFSLASLITLSGSLLVTKTIRGNCEATIDPVF